MRTPRLLALLAFTAGALAGTSASQPAAAQPSPGPRPAPAPAPAFTVATTYQHCTTTTMFACGKRDAAGNTYGTAHQQESCERYVLLPDGTFTAQTHILSDAGTYRIAGGKVRFTTTRRPGGALPATFELPLSADGAQLGDLRRVPR